MGSIEARGDAANRPQALGAAILASLLYPIMGVTTAALAGAAGSAQTRFLWRLSAFVISGLVFALHLAWEHFRLRSTARATAWRTAAAVALGAFGLALAANVHDLASPTGYRPRMLIALAVWPLLAGLPAFIAAWAIAAVLGLKRRT